MRDAEFAVFFAGICARLGLCVDGYRRTRGTVSKRVARRLRELGLASLQEYGRHLEASADEWSWLDQRCRITISRFARDRATYEALVWRRLPELAAAARRRGQPEL